MIPHDPGAFLLFVGYRCYCPERFFQMLRQTVLPLLLTGFAALTIAPAVAHADTFTLSTAQWNNSTCPKCGPTYGTVEVDYASATKATVTVTLSDPGRNIFFNQGGPASDGDAFEFNLAPGDFTITPVTAGFEADYSPSSDLYGSFTYGVDCDYKGGACQNAKDDPELTSLVFTIQSNGSTPINFTDTGNVLFTVAVTDNTDVDPTGNAAVVTPEPGSLALLGTGVLGAAGVLRRRIKA